MAIISVNGPISENEIPSVICKQHIDENFLAWLLSDLGDVTAG